MAYTRDELLIIERQLADAYHEAERRLIAILSQVELTAWARARSLDQLAQVQAILTALGEHTTAWANTHVPALYTEGVASADAALNAARAGLPVPPGLERLHTESITILGENLALRYDQVLQTVGRQAADFYRTAGLQALQETTALGGRRRDATRLMIAKLHEQGITSFIDRAGNKWSLGRYAEMVARTTSRECGNLAVVNRLLERGHDTVIVSQHAGACPKCVPWEGKRLSISGDSSDHPSLADAEAAGLFHPNCVHILAPWIEGYSDLTPPTPSPETASGLAGEGGN